ncbi:MAG: hypothetical protein QXL27_01005 [Candidatus Bathyarchaeia archaeon]
MSITREFEMPEDMVEQLTGLLWLVSRMVKEEPPKSGEDLVKRIRVPSGINVIPGIPGAPCYPILLVFIVGADSTRKRLTEACHHAGIYCRCKNRFIIFVTTKWDDREWMVHEQAFRFLRRECKLTALRVDAKDPTVIRQLM